jgi:hypothetical protein
MGETRKKTPDASSPSNSLFALRKGEIEGVISISESRAIARELRTSLRRSAASPPDNRGEENPSHSAALAITEGSTIFGPMIESFTIPYARHRVRDDLTRCKHV